MLVDRWLVIVGILILSLVVMAVLSLTARTPASSEQPLGATPLEFPHHVAAVSGLDLWLVQPRGKLHYELTCERPGLATDVQVGVGVTLTGRKRIIDIAATQCDDEPSLIAEGQLPELNHLNVGEAGTISLAAQPQPEAGDVSKIVIGIYRGKDARLYEGYGP